MDESGTHEGSPAISVGAFFAKPKVWSAFTTEWNVTKRRTGKAPVEVFHSTDCEALKGEFEGWSESERNVLVAQLMAVLAKHPLAGYGVGINLRALEAAFASRPDLQEFFGSPYIVCFKLAVETVIAAAEHFGSNEQLAFIHEANDYEMEAHKAFASIKKERKKHAGPMSLTFAGKSESVPLQAADVLAFETNKRTRDPKRPARRSLAALRLPMIPIEGFYQENMPLLVSRLEIMMEEVKLLGSPARFVGMSEN